MEVKIYKKYKDASQYGSERLATLRQLLIFQMSLGHDKYLLSCLLVCLLFWNKKYISYFIQHKIGNTLIALIN